MTTTADILSSVKPLCEATRQFLRPVKIQPNDRLSLEVDESLDHFIVEPYTLWHDGSIINPSWHTAVDRVASRYAEWKFIKNGRALLVPTTDTSALVTAAIWPLEHINFGENAEEIMQHRILRFIGGTQVAEWQAMSKLNVEPSWEFPSNEGFKHMRHQSYAAKCMLDCDGYNLYMEQGTGKTLVAITKLDERARKRNKRRPYRAIIVVPPNVITNWRDELENCSTLKGATYFIRGGRMDRAMQLLDAMQRKDVDWVACIVSMDTFWRMIATITSIDWDYGVIDEGHNFRSDKANRSDGLFKLRDACAERSLLTGTPMVNGPADFWTQLEWLYKGASGFHSKKNFRDFYSKFIEVSDTQKIFAGLQNVPLLQERLTRHAFFITKEEALPDLPPKVYDSVAIEMTPIQRRIYEKVAEELKAEAEEAFANSENRSITANHVLTRMLRLAQITSGFVPLDAVYDPETLELLHSREIQFFSPNPKLEALVANLKSMGPNSKSIVWACWRPDIQQICERLKKEGIEYVHYYGSTSFDEREEAKQAFNKGTARVFVGNQAAGGVGLTLLGTETQRADWIHYYSQGWPPVHRWQSEDRAHRFGTKWTVRITDYCVPDSIDEVIRVRVMKKKHNAIQVQDVTTMLVDALRCLSY